MRPNVIAFLLLLLITIGSPSEAARNIKRHGGPPAEFSPKGLQLQGSKLRSDTVARKVAKGDSGWTVDVGGELRSVRVLGSTDGATAEPEFRVGVRTKTWQSASQVASAYGCATSPR